MSEPVKERIEGLQALINQYKIRLDAQLRHRHRLDEHVRRLSGALTFYGDGNVDGGEIARRALSGFMEGMDASLVAEAMAADAHLRKTAQRPCCGDEE